MKPYFILSFAFLSLSIGAMACDSSAGGLSDEQSHLAADFMAGQSEAGERDGSADATGDEAYKKCFDECKADRQTGERATQAGQTVFEYCHDRCKELVTGDSR